MGEGEKPALFSDGKVTAESKTGQLTDQVDWHGPDDPNKPMNWPKSRRWFTIILLSGFAILNPLVSTAISPSAGDISHDLSITDPVVTQLCLSVYMLGIGIGPLFFGPLCELFGRIRILAFGNIFFLAWNTGAGFVRNEAQLIVCRFFSGVGSSAALSVLGPTVSDLFPPENRGKARAIAIVCGYMGPAIGPIAAGYITQNTTWRWVVWGISIVDVPVLVLGAVWLKETYPPVVLRRRAKKLTRETGKTFTTPYDRNDQTLVQKLANNLARPPRLITTQPIILVLCAYFASLYGAQFLVLFSYPDLWIQIYGQTLGQAGLDYLSSAVGAILAAQIGGYLSDRIANSLKQQNSGSHVPEYRIPLMVPGTLVASAGLIILGWSGQYHAHWIVPNIGLALFTGGVEISTMAVMTYTLDAYTRYSASALSTLNLVRSLAAFLLPLAAPSMYARLGYGWASSVLALLILALGLLAAFVLWNFGKWLRIRSPFAAGGYKEDA